METRRFYERLFPAFGAGQRQPQSPERTRNQAGREFRRHTPRMRRPFTKPAITDEQRKLWKNHLRRLAQC